MTQPVPLVSVTMRTRNREKYLGIAVSSVVNQTFKDWELIISDDASTDGTPALGQSWVQQDPRIRYVRHDPALGASNNWRFCLSESSGAYFAALDDDNLYLPDFLMKMVTPLEAHPQSALAFADEWRIDGEGVRNLAETEADSRHYHRAGLQPGLHTDMPLLATRQAFSINASMFRRDALLAAGGFRKLAGDFADFDVFLSLAQQGHSAWYVSDRLAEYRRHGSQDGDTYFSSIPKADASIQILESYRFTGEAEAERTLKLAQAYVSLSRVLLLNQNVKEARKALQKAIGLDPGRPRTLALAAFLNLPEPLIRRGLQFRYGNKAVSSQL